MVMTSLGKTTAVVDENKVHVQPNLKVPSIVSELVDYRCSPLIYYKINTNIRYYKNKYRRVNAPHVVMHYAAGARLIGLTEKQLARHLERLQASNQGM